LTESGLKVYGERTLKENEPKKLLFSSRDTPARLRERLSMVEEQIVQRGVKDVRVLDALRTVPRHLFVPEAERDFAYDDRPLPLGYGQTISQPYIVAVMTEALQLSGNEKVLEVGTGSGYQAAILALLASEVCSVERIPELASAAAGRLFRLGVHNVTVLCRDGSLGLSEEAPFDAIIVTAAAPQPPRALVDQLADGGRIVVPSGDRDDQKLLKITRHGDSVTQEDLGLCVFVPLIGEGGWKAGSESNAD
jgi:protein-L-isoaspartate(D-aspartate) O-methyltransferase